MVVVIYHCVLILLNSYISLPAIKFLLQMAHKHYSNCIWSNIGRKVYHFFCHCAHLDSTVYYTQCKELPLKQFRFVCHCCSPFIGCIRCTSQLSLNIIKKRLILIQYVSSCSTSIGTEKYICRQAICVFGVSVVHLKGALGRDAPIIGR